jgi:hypothetical protein
MIFVRFIGGHFVTPSIMQARWALVEDRSCLEDSTVPWPHNIVSLSPAYGFIASLFVIHTVVGRISIFRR